MLKIDQGNWRSRWLYTDGNDFIHRVAEATWGSLPLLDDPNDVFEPNGPDDEEMIEAMGTTLCGLSGRLIMPGIFSRMGAPRCPECCNKMGIAEGKGNPFNKGILEPGDVKTPIAEENSSGGVPAFFEDCFQETCAMTEQKIRELAYAKWLAAGTPPGDGVNFWLAAEAELNGSPNSIQVKPMSQQLQGQQPDRAAAKKSVR